MSSVAPRGIPCPRCRGLQHKVTNTEPLPDGRIRRRRTCRNCGCKLVTFEARPGPAARSEQAAQAASGGLQAAR